MYIALKWLIGMATAMWVVMCCIDLCLKKGIKEVNPTGSINIFSEITYKNVSEPIGLTAKVDKLRNLNTENKFGFAALHYATFIAGAFLISMLKKKNEIITYTTRIDIRKHITSIRKKMSNLKKTASRIRVVICNFLLIFGELCKIAIKKTSTVTKSTPKNRHQDVSFLLVQKLREFGEHRRKLGLLLITALHEHKNMKKQCQLENLAKTRLMSLKEEMQKQAKVNRSKYINLQQLYLVSLQENRFLKLRVKKLTQEKEKVERNLIGLVNKVCLSKNNELKAYCTKFLVNTKDNFFNSDMGVEIDKFLLKSHDVSVYNPGRKWNSSIQIRSENIQITELLDDDTVVSVEPEAPKLRGLPGEYVWTVKDKNGMIEKLYEYNCESDLDNRETIRRIREYSVYYDREGLLDFLNHSNMDNLSKPNIRYPSKQNFLTGSQAFREFLENNKKIALPSRSPTPQLLRG